VFTQAWTYLNDHFYDEDFHGVDWGAVREAYAPVIAGARTRAERRRAVSLMVGELNASHLGVSGRGRQATPTGRLGLSFDREEYERNGRLRVAEVLPLGPAAVAGGIEPGDYVLAVDGDAVGAGVHLDALRAGKGGRRVEPRVARGARGAGS